ncbi:MAG: hypothetical protein K5696_13070 [Lachnospiraceae bacterium]|nr:hypothetical protein [Lachnospiraceae bacterium]
MNLTPVSLSFISWLEDLLNELFTDVFAPVVKAFLYIGAHWLFGIWSAFIYRFLFRIFVILLKIVYVVEQIFDIFSCQVGVFLRDPVTKEYHATTAIGNSAIEQDSLLDVLIRDDIVTHVVLRLTLAAFVLCFLFTIFAVIKSMGDSLGENKKPVSHVLKATTKACLYFALIPITVIFSVKVVGVCTSAIVTYIPQNMYGANMANTQYSAATEAQKSKSNHRMSNQAALEKSISLKESVTTNANTRICDVIFYICCAPAYRKGAANELGYYTAGQHFQDNFDDLVNDFDVAMVNYLLGLAFVILMLLVLLVLILQCIIRIFAILVLYVVSPYFVAMIPLDDGAKFKRWREMFVAFSISTFGPIITMRFYLSLVPFVVIDNGFTFSSTTPVNPLSEIIIQIIFIVGGAYAVWKSQNMLVSLVDPEAGSTLMKSMMLMNMAMNRLTGGASQMVAKGLGSIKGEGGGD